jgi:hypothetical protein
MQLMLGTTDSLETGGARSLTMQAKCMGQENLHDEILIHLPF